VRCATEQNELPRQAEDSHKNNQTLAKFCPESVSSNPYGGG